MEKWNSLFAQIFADFPDERVLEEARKTLEAMGHMVQHNGSYHVIPSDVLLMIVRRSLHHDERLRSGGSLAFEIAVGPHFTTEGLFSGVCDYGVLRLEFGLDGTHRDDFFAVSPLLSSPDLEWEYERLPKTEYALAEKPGVYEKAD